MNVAYLITGGNIGDRKKNLATAAHFIQTEIGNIERLSQIYETEPWGNTDQEPFYNQVLVVETALDAPGVMQKILLIEAKMGRVRTFRNAARIIDIDILFFNNDIVNEQNLTIPHPEIANRRFVLQPLNELAPGLVHPLYAQTIHELLRICTDPLKASPLRP